MLCKTRAEPLDHHRSLIANYKYENTSSDLLLVFCSSWYNISYQRHSLVILTFLLLLIVEICKIVRRHLNALIWLSDSCQSLKKTWWSSIPSKSIQFHWWTLIKVFFDRLHYQRLHHLSRCNRSGGGQAGGGWGRHLHLMPPTLPSAPCLPPYFSQFSPLVAPTPFSPSPSYPTRPLIGMHDKWVGQNVNDQGQCLDSKVMSDYFQVRCIAKTNS